MGTLLRDLLDSDPMQENAEYCPDYGPGGERSAPSPSGPSWCSQTMPGSEITRTSDDLLSVESGARGLNPV